MRQLASVNDFPWACIGDYNDLLPADKKGRVEHPQWLYRGFREAVSDCNLIDIPLLGYNYTWHKSRGSVNVVEERLDRAMANPSWHARFPNATLHCLVAPVLDHHPILLTTDNSFWFLGRKGLNSKIGGCWKRILRR